ncbi:hypothetical protein L915_00799 [Phytophthora nicotianae]|uniref:Uncharacterized protein n=1 Tax=Phytophthora nicotianae TaxID=4792 RepID=W2HMK5_PHYNI|nr:hypothetical protein L915_00799 [Phytophthora nicotianae]
MGNIFDEVPTQVYYVSICSCADVSSIPSFSLGTPVKRANREEQIGYSLDSDNKK